MRTPFVLVAALAATAASAGEYSPTPDALAVHRALSVRHWDGDCAAVEALARDPVAALQEVVDHARAPATAPMRAATCLIRGHAAERRAEIERWVTEPDLKGLGMLALKQLDAMPEPVAVAVATRALATDLHAEQAREAAAASVHPAVRALLAPVEAQ